jgi:hypothetical protein
MQKRLKNGGGCLSSINSLLLVIIWLSGRPLNERKEKNLSNRRADIGHR